MNSFSGSLTRGLEVESAPRLSSRVDNLICTRSAQTLVPDNIHHLKKPGLLGKELIPYLHARKTRAGHSLLEDIRSMLASKDILERDPAKEERLGGREERRKEAKL